MDKDFENIEDEISSELDWKILPLTIITNRSDSFKDKGKVKEKDLDFFRETADHNARKNYKKRPILSMKVKAKCFDIKDADKMLSGFNIGFWTNSKMRNKRWASHSRVMTTSFFNQKRVSSSKILAELLK